MRSKFPTCMFTSNGIGGADRDRLARYLMDAGFHKEREISFPHKQSNLMKIKRDAWEGPCL